MDDAAQHVMDGFAALELHADVANGVDRLHEDGFRLATLSNGAASVADRLLTAANVRDRFEQLLSVEDAGAWKPSPGRLRVRRARSATCRPRSCCSSPVHPWDVDGARRAGLQSAWVNRLRTARSRRFPEPTYTVGA